MHSPSSTPWFWSSDHPLWNFGDALTLVLTDELICDFFPYSARTHLLGSVLFDHLLPASPDPIDGLKPSLHPDRETKAVFWGCGIREPGSLHPDLLSNVEILSVRGPVSASDLRLGSLVPLGDPALLLPALYQPRRIPALAGKVVCVPHYNDQRSDAEILAISGCDVVLRPAIRKHIDAIYGFIDALASAKFVLAGAMHSAITAAAYGVPFGFWDSGAIDIPTKWQDLASLLSIPCRFFQTASEASEFHDHQIAPTLKIPSLWPLLAAAPGFIKPVGLAKVLKYEIERQNDKSYPEFEPFIDELVAQRALQDRLLHLARRIILEVLPHLDDERQSAVLALETASSEKAALLSQLAVQKEAAAGYDRLASQHLAKLADHAHKAEETSRALEAVTSERDDLLEQIRGERAEVDRIKKEAVRLAAEHRSLQQAMETVNEEHGHTLQQLQALRATENLEHQKTVHALADLTARHNAAEVVLKTQLDNNQQLQASLDQLRDQQSADDRQHREGALVQDGLLAEAQSERDHALREIAQLQSRINAMETDLNERRSVEGELRVLVNKQEKQIRVQQLDLEQHRSDHEALRTEAARLLNDTQTLSTQRNRSIEELARLKADLQRASDEVVAQRHRNADLDAALSDQRSEAYSLRQQSLSLVTQISALQGSSALAENLNAARLARLDAGLARYWHLIARANSKANGAGAITGLLGIGRGIKLLRSRLAKINAFLETFSDAELGLPRTGRNRRVTQYLLGITPDIDDFPIFHRDIYLQLNPDVAEEGLEPFIHFIENGQWENRQIHPAMDLQYYTSCYPEAGKFKISPIEHYFKFGVRKNYNPSALFSTKWYLETYKDVRLSGLNPVIHYLRFPGCQPHPSFDSYYYQISNPDVVRQGFNPLAHYCLWGRSEGRRGTSSTQSSKDLIVDQPPLTETSRQFEGQNEAALNTRPTTASIQERHVEKPLAPLTSRKESPTQVIVMIDAFYPRPDQDSGSLDQVNFVKIFSGLGFDVAFVSLLQFGEPADAGLSVSSLGAHCITSGEFASIEEYLFLHQPRIVAVFLSRVHFGGAWIDRVRTFCPKALVLFNTVDLHHLREERAAALNPDAARLLVQARETKRLEYECIAAADISIVVSEKEQKLLQNDLPSAKVAVIPLIREIPRDRFPSFNERSGLAFIGGFQHQPNIDAITYFLDEIWPNILNMHPDLTFFVIGSHLPVALSERSDRKVNWVGYVPSLEPWLDRVRLTVAPLRYGAGAKGKVVSSLINGVPCVATGVAAEGMGLKIGRDIVGCDDPSEFARAVIALHEDPVLWERFAIDGFKAVREAYSIAAGQSRMKDILRTVTADRPLETTIP